jgi:hypothetical protein
MCLIQKLLFLSQVEDKKTLYYVEISQPASLESVCVGRHSGLATSLALGGNMPRRLCSEHEDVSDMNSRRAIILGRWFAAEAVVWVMLTLKTPGLVQREHPLSAKPTGSSCIMVIPQPPSRLRIRLKYHRCQKVAIDRKGCGESLQSGQTSPGIFIKGREGWKLTCPWTNQMVGICVTLGKLRITAESPGRSASSA